MGEAAIVFVDSSLGFVQSGEPSTLVCRYASKVLQEKRIVASVLCNSNNLTGYNSSFLCTVSALPS